MTRKHPIELPQGSLTRQMRECHQIVGDLMNCGWGYVTPDRPTDLHAFIRFVMTHPIMGVLSADFNWSRCGMTYDQERALVAARKIMVLVGAVSAEMQNVCRSQNERTLREYRDIIDAAKALQVCP